MKKFKIDKNKFTLEVWTIETPLKSIDFRYHHLGITSRGVYFDGTLIAKGKLKLVKEKITK